MPVHTHEPFINRLKLYSKVKGHSTAVPQLIRGQCLQPGRAAVPWGGEASAADRITSGRC